MSQLIKEQDEVPVIVRSKVTTPIGELSFLRRSLLFAELAMFTYNDESEAARAAELAGFPDATFSDRDGSQAFRFRNEHDCIIACRGTEPNEWNDIRADANAASVLAETVGKVHRGFKQEAASKTNIFAFRNLVGSRKFRKDVFFLLNWTQWVS